MRGSPFLLLTLVSLFLCTPLRAEREEDRPGYKVGVLFWHDSENDKEALRGIRAGFELAGMPANFEVVNVNEDAAAAARQLSAWGENDLVYAMGTAAARQAKAAGIRAPVVFTAVTNPVKSGIVPDWSGAGKGVNLCGNSNWIRTEEVLRAFQGAYPDLSRLGVVLVGEPNPNPVSNMEVDAAKALRRADPRKANRLIVGYMRSADDLEKAVTDVLDRGAQALWVPIDIAVYKNLDRVEKITGPRGIPIFSSQHTAVRDHAVVAVAVDYFELGRRSVILAERVLRSGADPGTLEVGRMSSYRVLVNLDAARRIGFQIPLEFLAVADRILGLSAEDR